MQAIRRKNASFERSAIYVMTLVLTAAVCAVTLGILSGLKLTRAAAGAPALMIALGAGLSFAYRATGAPFLPSEWVAASADTGLAALAFAAATQLRVSRFARHCPASFRLTVGGAPLFLILCSLTAFVLAPQLSLPSALLVGAVLMLNGAAFDRRAVTNAPAPAVVKATVRLESAAILALGVPVAALLEANAAVSAPGLPAVTPLYETSLALLKGFAMGGALGVLFAKAGNWLRLRNGGGAFAVAAAAAGFLLSPLISAHPVIAATAAGLLWGEETKYPQATRMRLRRSIEEAVGPAAYFAFGCLMAPRIFQADLLAVVFALAAVTVMRAGPRLAALQTSSLPKESQAFLAWFGGAPGAASALFLISLIGGGSLVDQDAVFTIGAVAVTAGVVAARLTSRPLANAFLRETVAARKRRMFAG
ncbi:MAG: cation:proton antiporter [Parvularculaceae bacterium]